MDARKKSKRRTYSEDDMKKAIAAAKMQNYSVKKAAITFKVPRSTLILRLKGWKNRKPSINKSAGRQVDLSPEVETNLACKIKTMANWGFGLSRKEILLMVGSYVKNNNIKTRFKGGIPGKDWFVGFCRRHRLSCKKPVKRQTVRTEQTTPEIIYGFFDLYEDTVKQLGLTDKPSQIFNLDETSLCSDPSNTKVVSEKNRAVFRNTQGTGRTNTSILFCISANGEKLPPFILYHAKHLWDIWMPEEAYPNTGYAATPSGWMTEASFLSWFKNHFLKHCPQERPLLLVFDGHSSHVSVDLIETAIKENITLLRLPPHTTHLLQPLDSITFGVLKKKFDEELTIWQRENYGRALSKAQFSIMVGKIWMEFSQTLLKKSFQTTGLYNEMKPENPIDRTVIKESAFKPAELQLYTEKQTQTNSELTSTENDIPVVGNSATEVSIPSTNGASNLPSSISDADLSSQDPVASTSSQKDVPSPLTFESLLLQKIARHRDVTVNRRKRISNTAFANVLTREEYVEELKKSKERAKNKPSRKQDPVQSDSDTDSKVESDLDRMLNNSDSDDTQTLQDFVEAEQESLNCDIETPKELKVGGWILVDYKTINQKHVKRYVGRVLKINASEDQLLVKYLRKKTKFFIWPQSDDIDSVPPTSVHMLLPEPKEGRRNQFTFPIQFDGLNVY